MSKFQYLDRIESFLKGEMSEAERQFFEADLQSNEQLKKEYEACLATEKVIDVLAFQKQKGRLTPTQEPTEKKSKYLGRRLLVAAAVLLLLAIGGSLWYAERTYNNTSIAERLYEPPNFTGLRGESAYFAQLDQATQAYYKQNYEQAISLLNTIPKQDSAYTYAQLMLGCSLIENKNYQDAINSLLYVTKNSQERKQRAQWYLLLAYLGVNDMGNVNKLISEIQNEPNHYFKEELNILIKDLNSVWRKIII